MYENIQVWERHLTLSQAVSASPHQDCKARVRKAANDI